MAWPGSTTFDATYHWQKTANFSAFLYAMNNLHKIVDNDGSGVAPSTDLVSPLPSDNDYCAAGGVTAGTPFAQPFVGGVIGIPIGKRMYAINTVHAWVDHNKGKFVVPATYAGQPRFKTWSNGTDALANPTFVENIYQAIGVVGVDGAGLQNGFTRKRPAWINSLAATSFIDDAGNNTNTPATNDVVYFTSNGRKYKYNGGGSWSLQVYSQAQVRTLVGCGLPRVGDYYTYPEFWQELYDAIQKLRWTYSANSFFISPPLGVGGAMIDGSNVLERNGAGSSTVSQANAKAIALANYNATEFVGGSGIGGLVESYVHDHLSATSPSWDALLHRMRGKITPGGAADVVAQTAPLLARTWDYYYVGKQFSNYPIDALGTGLDTSGNLTSLGSEGPTSASKTKSAFEFLGAGVDPTWPTTVTVNTAVEHDVDGALAYFFYIIFKWDVAGGLPHL